MKLKLNFKARHASVAALTNIAVLAALIIFNLLFQNIPAQWDMTRRKLFSLTDTTVSMVKNLDRDVQIYLLSKPGQEPKDILEVLQRYDSASSRVSLEIIDPDRNPGLISAFTEEGQTVAAGSVIVASGEYSRVIARLDLYSISYSQQGQPQLLGMTVEQRVTSAISYVTTGREPKVYVLEGHNEYSLRDLGLEEVVQKANFGTETLNLLREGAVPSDADVLIILSPERDLTVNEAAAVDSYLQSGGALFLSLDMTGSSTPNFDSLLEKYNLVIEQGFVMEKDTNRLLPGMSNNPLFFSPALAEDNVITDTLRENSLDTFVFTSMGIRETEIKKRNLKFTPILSSSDSSWLRSDLNNTSEFRTSSDIPGPIPVAASIAETSRDTGAEEGARIIVLASGKSLASLPGIGQIKANIEFFLNSLNWLSDQEESINIPSKSLFRLPMRLNALQAWIYGGICVILIPLIIIISAAVVLYRRKNL
ncbi:MAG: GldG family protein [Spirochaetales bacterium]|nr:GldG family protein [Spirochaetales bacterium]